MSALILILYSIKRKEPLLLVFAAFSGLLGVRGAFDIITILTGNTTICIIGYFITVFGVLVLFFFIELIFHRFTIIETILAFLYGILIVRTFYEPIKIYEISNFIVFVQYSNTTNLISGIMYIIVDVFAMYFSYELYKSTKLYKIRKKYAYIFIIGVIFGFNGEISAQLLSIVIEPLQLTLPLIVAGGNLLLLYLLIVEPALIYIVPLKVQSIHIYHKSGVEIFSNSLMSGSSLEKFSDVFYIISQSIEKVQLNINYINFETYVLQFIRCSEILVFFISHSYNKVLYELIYKAACRMDNKLKGIDILSDEVQNIIQEELEKFPFNLLNPVSS